jgi:hypothetical protein
LFLSSHSNIRDANEKQLHRIKQDLVLKNNSLDLDNKCMRVREQLTSGPVTQTQKNLGTFRTDRELYTAMNAIQY